MDTESPAQAIANRPRERYFTGMRLQHGARGLATCSQSDDMSQIDVQQIMKMIDGLSESDRELLEQRLAERAEPEWREEAEEARRQAKARGIDQSAIDEAIRKRRYGQ